MLPRPAALVAVLTALSLLAFAAPASAQERSRPSRPDEVVDLLRAQRRASIERRVGWGLSGAGLAIAAAGAVVLGYGLDRGTWNDVTAVIVSGSVLSSVGGAMLIPGVVLALHGQEKLTDAEWRLKQLGVLPTLAFGPSGVWLGARLVF